MGVVAYSVGLGAGTGETSVGLVAYAKVVATSSGPTAEAGVPSCREDGVAWVVVS